MLSSCVTGTGTQKAPAERNNFVSDINPAANETVESAFLNIPPETSDFYVAGSDNIHPRVMEAIKKEMLNLGFSESASREQAKVVVWYEYSTKQQITRFIGSASDIWGERAVQHLASGVEQEIPGRFSLQIVSLDESSFPDKTVVIWKAEWYSPESERNLADFATQKLSLVFENYGSEDAKFQLEQLKQNRDRARREELQKYMNTVMYRIQSNWRKPKYNVTGKKCEIKIEQSAVGEIKSHKILNCDRDSGFRRSIEKAIKKSSPLPLPRRDDFDRSELILIFKG